MNPAAMEAFAQALAGKSVIAMQQDQGEDDTEHALSKQIKATIRQDTYNMYIQQKVLYLAEGCTFKAIGTERPTKNTWNELELKLTAGGGV